ncbi:Uncharacterised protein [uncultured archaeon]|nr:Uncharacterised protein [uncultured archaeon]
MKLERRKRSIRKSNPHKRKNDYINKMSVIWIILIVVVLIIVIVIVARKSGFISDEYPLPYPYNVKFEYPHRRVDTGDSATDDAHCYDRLKEKIFTEKIVDNIKSQNGQSNECSEDQPQCDFDLKTLYLGKMSYDTLPYLRDGVMASYNANKKFFKELCDYDENEVWHQIDFLDNPYRDPCNTCKACNNQWNHIKC